MYVFFTTGKREDFSTRDPRDKEPVAARHTTEAEALDTEGFAGIAWDMKQVQQEVVLG